MFVYIEVLCTKSDREQDIVVRNVVYRQLIKNSNMSVMVNRSALE